MNVDLTALATDTVHHLGQVWDAVGAPSGERDTALGALTAAVQRAYKNAVEEAERDRDTLVVEVATVTEVINALVARLGGVAGAVCAADDLKQNLRARLAALRAQLQAAEGVKSEHVAKLDAALASLHALWTQLGSTYEPGFEKMTEQIDAARLTAIQQRIGAAQHEMHERTETVKTRIAEISDLVQGLCIDSAEIAASELLHHVMQQNVDAIGVHAATMAKIDDKKAELIAEKQRRQERLKRLAVKITALWDRLCVSTAERQAFFGQHRGLGLMTLQFCEQELVRLEQLKQDKLQEQTEALRARLHTMWDECHYAHDDRHRFAPLAAVHFTDEIYDAHEAEVKSMEVQVQAMRPILALIERRNQILSDKAEYEEMLKNPNRFKIAGWSIREEGIRKMLNKEFPKLNAKLLEDLNTYEASYGELLYEGIQYRACLQGELSSLHSAEEEEKSRKASERAKNFQGSASSSASATSSSTSSSTAATASSSAPLTTPRKPSSATISATASSSSLSSAVSLPKSAARPASAAASRAPLSAVKSAVKGAGNPENLVAPSPRVDAASKIPARANQFGFSAQKLSRALDE